MGSGASKQQPVENWSMVKNTSQGKLFHDDQNANEVEEKLFKLTTLQKQMIVDSWNNIEDKTKFGQMILKNLFCMNVAHKHLYQLENVPDEKHSQTLKFTTKADHITSFIESVVGVLIKNEKAILKVAKTFGLEHIRPKIETNADAQYWEMLKESILEEIESEQKNLGIQYSETKMSKNINDAWGEMMTEVISIAKTSYAEARRKLNNSKKQLVPKAAQIARKVNA